MKPVSLSTVLLLRLSDLILQPLIGGRVLKISLHVVDPLEEPFPQLLVQGTRLELLDLLAEQRTERISGQGIEGEPDNGKLPRKNTLLREVIERGKEFALGEVAAGAENHHHAWRSG